MNAKIYSVANELQKMITELFIDALNVHLKLLDIRKLKPYAEEILHTLPEERRQKALNYRKEEDKMRSIGSSFLIMQTVSWQKVYYGKYGKPLAHGKNFNVSHSGNYVVLAESENPIGVDIEELRNDITSDLIDAVLTKREKSWSGNSFLRFYILWTRKESLLKCAGTGFGINPNRIDVLPKENPTESIQYMGNFYRFFSTVFDNNIISITVHGLE